ncbi:hypothetical protein [Thiorhodovibrio frisius]|uniref:Uncharacterized protein n=1 Tax=Thiorhodovibrio frisius TaxID=631362 RepID=H8YVT9_9GAMM|nr:hypothetical protein [Thiorhodovibrio frisius]EIC24029.1 hypothetical protein Thi970DRAFT_00170 [Thiorhodovibrio frisius]WPL23103.1 hypothetical protein Thiofri_03285 [Thiorhodovibrio frisius]
MSLSAIDLTLTLEDDVALTAFAATVGHHETLPYLPGACVMGYLASRLYRTLGDDGARLLFHSDRVRFGDARLLTDAGPARPTPRTWHYAKSAGKPFADANKNQLRRDRLYDARHDAPDRTLRYKAFDGGELDATSGRLANPRKGYRQGTAIDPAANRAAEGQLFGYQSLEAGQCFRGQIRFATEIPAALVQQVGEQLHQATLLIGRSRSAHYGRVRSTASAISAPPLPDIAPETTELTLWLLSDLAAWDADGQPTLWPRAEWLGLPAGQLVPERTFLASRRYSPWNAYAGCRDHERLVIARGSVLTFQLAAAWMETHRAQLALGLGGYLAYGLGEIALYPEVWDWPAPESASPSEPNNEPTHATDARKDAAIDAYSRDLLHWLDQSTDTDGQQLEADLRQLGELYQRFRRLHGLTPQDQAGPRKTHWADIERIATSGRDDIAARLAELPRIWHESTYGPGAEEHFAHWVQQWAPQPARLARLAVEARRRNIMGETS